jgi:predicted DNA-binding transcriptional regulator YafY
MPPVPAGRKFEIVTQALALAEERGYIPLADAAAEIGVSVEQLRELLGPVLFLEFEDGQGGWIEHTHEFVLDEDDVLQLEAGHTNWLRDLVATAPSNEGLLRLYIAATVFQATSPRESPDLDRALAKLRQAIAMEMVIPVDRPRATAVADQARTAHRSLRFRYVKWKSPVAEDREILPYDVYSDWGHWYVWGPKVDDPDGIVRTWRLDRMHDPVAGDRTFDPPLDLPPRGWFDLSEHTRTLTVVVPETRLPALPRPHTVQAREVLADGRIRAVIAVAGDRQLDHLLVALGPDGEVLDPPEYAKRRRDEARRLLAHVEAD